MKFNQTTSQLGLIQDCEDLTGLGNGNISGDTTKLNTFTRNINAYYRKADSWIWEAIGAWEFDDSGKTTLPVATTDLVINQRDYSIPSTARKIDKVEIKDDNGDWNPVYPIDKSEFKRIAMEELYETNGLPAFYDMAGQSILLYPKPATANVTTTAGLKLYFSRDIIVFSSSATTREPGFDNHFHRICSIGASYDWCSSKGLKKTPRLKRELGELKVELQTFYGSRHRDFKTRIDVSEDSNI